MGVPASGLSSLDPPLNPPLIWAEIVQHMCLDQYKKIIPRLNNWEKFAFIKDLLKM